jgi:cytidylate kinase
MHEERGMPILAMTREVGSLGTFIGQEVARRQGYTFVRHQIIAEAAQLYEAAEEKLIATVEAKPVVWDGLSDAARRHFAFVAAEVFDAALKDNVVIVGRWSTLLLRGVAHVLRVRVCAPMDLRIRRIVKRLGVGPDEARVQADRSDQGVRARIRQFFDVEWNDPLLYDMVLNTERFSKEAGADLLCSWLARPEWQPTDASRAVLQDAALAARVRAALKADPETGRLNVKILCRAGRLELAGTVESPENREAAARLAANQPGVLSVENHLTVMGSPRW